MITIPTLQELYTDVLADLQAEYGTSVPTFGKNFLRALAAVQAAKLKIYYLAIGNLQKNIFADTADPEASGGTLERFGRGKLGRNPFPATPGEYTIQVTGEIGATIPARTTFKSNDDSTNPGKLFILDVAYVLVSATDSITVRALEGGIDSKMFVTELMTATAPILDVNRSATVTAEVTEPLAAEDIEDYREKVVNAFTTEPQGGAASDYRDWASDAQGVAKVYPYASSGNANEIDLYIEATIADSTDGKGTPSAGLISDVEDVIELDPDTTKPINERGRRPLGVFQINYMPVTIKEVDIEINDYDGLTAEIQTEIEQALEEAIAEIRPFVAGADVLAEKNDILDTNRIIAIILGVRPGAVFGTVELRIDGVLMSTFTFENGDIPWLDSVTFPY